MTNAIRLPPPPPGIVLLTPAEFLARDPRPVRLLPLRFECATCGAGFLSLAWLLEHREERHVPAPGPEVEIACGLCAKGLERYWRLGGRWHTTKRWYHKLDARNEIACGSQETANEHDPIYAR